MHRRPSAIKGALEQQRDPIVSSQRDLTAVCRLQPIHFVHRRAQGLLALIFVVMGAAVAWASSKCDVLRLGQERSAGSFIERSEGTGLVVMVFRHDDLSLHRCLASL